MREQIEPGDGWRLLGPDDVLRHGDEMLFYVDHKAYWMPAPDACFNQPVAKHFIYRRRIPAKPEPDGTLFYEWRVENQKATIRLDIEKAELNARQARQLADRLTRYADWREAQESK
jgi:hypothetical protein